MIFVPSLVAHMMLWPARLLARTCYSFIRHTGSIKYRYAFLTISYIWVRKEVIWNVFYWENPFLVALIVPLFQPAQNLVEIVKKRMASVRWSFIRYRFLSIASFSRKFCEQRCLLESLRKNKQRWWFLCNFKRKIHCYGKWKSINARKFGCVVSIRVHPYGLAGRD